MRARCPICERLADYAGGHRCSESVLRKLDSRKADDSGRKETYDERLERGFELLRMAYRTDPRVCVTEDE